MSDDLDWDKIENFFDEFDYWGSVGWLTAILNGEVDLDVLRECGTKHSEDTLGDTLPKKLFIKNVKTGDYNELWREVSENE